MTAVTPIPVQVGADGVTLREIITPAAAEQAAELLRLVWKGDDSPVPGNLLVTVQHTGGYVFGAYDSGGVMVGVTLGLLTDKGLHSHITGVVPTGQRRGLGMRLKLHQREWALAHGLSTITWTCDPLVLRNVVFNLHALGASVSDYLPDFYGPMADGLNRGDETDRFELTWDLAGPSALRALQGRLPFLEPIGMVIPLPQDIESLRTTDPAAALVWRHTVRDAVLPALERGMRIQGLTAEGALVLE